jgi:hemerythrin-like domain-containing protein
VFKNLFSFLFSRGSAEEHVARYVVREHDRGRTLTEILEDKYVQNRLTPDQQRRLLDRPEMLEAFAGDTLERAKASISS